MGNDHGFQTIADIHRYLTMTGRSVTYLLNCRQDDEDEDGRLWRRFRPLDMALTGAATA
jgi:hypothetical protein